MIISNKAVMDRLNSPHNLINQIKNSKNNAMSLFGVNKKIISPFEEQKVIPKTESPKNEPSVEDLIKNSESQVKLNLAHNSALELMNNSIALMASKLDDVKADKLPSVITAAGKVVESIRKERNESNKNGKDREVHYHFYTPKQKALNDFAVIDV